MTQKTSQLLISYLLIGGAIGESGALGDCTTQPVPTSRVEVAVPCSGGGCESCVQGRFPSCQFDSCGRLIVAWEDNPRGTTSQPVQDHVRVLRFDADGSALPYSGGTCGSPLSAVHTPCPNQSRPIPKVDRTRLLS